MTTNADTLNVSTGDGDVVGTLQLQGHSVVSNDFLETLYKWLARAHFESHTDEVRAAQIGSEILSILKSK